jgi:hypothetical protein
MARMARLLDHGKARLPYGEFERWARARYPTHPIQVLRYLRKAHRVFGRDLARLLERHGQKKVFLLLGLPDPRAPLSEGIRIDGSGAPRALDAVTVGDLRRAVQTSVRRSGTSVAQWGVLRGALDRLQSVWPRLTAMPAALIASGAALGTRSRLVRLRSVLSDLMTRIDQILIDGSSAERAPERHDARRPPGRSVTRPLGFVD